MGLSLSHSIRCSRPMTSFAGWWTKRQSGAIVPLHGCLPRGAVESVVYLNHSAYGQKLFWDCINPIDAMNLKFLGVRGENGVWGIKWKHTWTKEGQKKRCPRIGWTPAYMFWTRESEVAGSICYEVYIWPAGIFKVFVCTLDFMSNIQWNTPF